MAASFCTMRAIYHSTGLKCYKLSRYIPELSNRNFHSKSNITFFRLKQGIIFASSTTNSGVNVNTANNKHTDSHILPQHSTEAYRGSVLYDRPTEPGQKKDTSCELPAAYSPKYVEAAWYDWWVSRGFFQPNNRIDSSDKFVMCLPPPNVTGTLHLGHALQNAIEDVIVRWHRMKGTETLWVPGCDHAGIATQVVVEKELWRREKVSRHDLGRERFVQEVWKWKDLKGDAIYRQMRKLGSSVDWSREVFTMDERLSKAVVEAFVRLHDKGLIYRSKRLVNWSCQLKSVISDIEVDNVPLQGKCQLSVPGYEETVQFGSLLYFAYPVENTGEEIVVATTRPETILGDAAVAVHPDDERFTHLHRKYVRHPFTGKQLPIVCDPSVDREFGTGAVKVTPAHDYMDYEIGVRHNLPFLSVIDDEGKMENTGENFDGVHRFIVRKRVVEGLKERGLFRGDADHAMVVPICSRSTDIVEPRLKDQWFLNCSQMAADAVQAVRSKELTLVPDFYERQWFEWLEKIRDWCISRQLWWGHRIPAYQVIHANSSENTCLWVSGRNEREAQDKAASQLGISPEDIELKQDDDVLDTWFSSALFPFSALGWPDQTPDLQKYYPMELLETGSDILFFWVARMVMLGTTLTGKLPFPQVLLHGILRDAHGRKMSKSLGNVIDPMDVISGISLQGLSKQLESSNLDSREMEKARQGQRADFPDGIRECGTDALRFTLCSYDIKAQDISMSVAHVVSSRHFCNKIWQAAKFVHKNLGEDFKPMQCFKLCGDESPLDLWVLSRLSNLVHACDQHFQSYDLQLVTKALHSFWLNDFCDVYLECVKPVFQCGSETAVHCTSQVLYTCLETYLRLISPFMPFLSEELFQRMVPRVDNWPESICIAHYSKPDCFVWQHDDIEADLQIVKTVSTKIQSVAQEYSLRKADVTAFLQVPDDQVDKYEELKKYMQALTRVGSLTVISPQQVDLEGSVCSIISPQLQLYIKLKGKINAEREMEKLHRKMAKLEKEIEKLEKRMSGKGYREGTPEDIQSLHRDKMSCAREEQRKVEEVLKLLENL